ncbi:hypothetical protein AOLI_G00297400 [Acnodon oligacanthus]
MCSMLTASLFLFRGTDFAELFLRLRIRLSMPFILIATSVTELKDCVIKTEDGEAVNNNNNYWCKHSYNVPLLFCWSGFCTGTSHIPE